MVSWSTVASAEPEFAERVQTIFDAHKHKTIATLRVDGAPRISGIEAEFVGGELRFGSMPASRKGADLRRDPRFALHSATVDAPEDEAGSWPGDVKVAGQAVPAGDVGGAGSAGPGELFHADIDEVVHTYVQRGRLVIELWRPGRGLRRFDRA